MENAKEVVNKLQEYLNRADHAAALELLWQTFENSNADSLRFSQRAAMGRKIAGAVDEITAMGEVWEAVQPLRKVLR